MERVGGAAVVTLAALVALVAMATGNLTMLGIGDGALLYDTIALPRLAIAVVGLALVALVWALGVARGGGQLRFDVVWALLGALAAWGLLSTLLSPHRALAVLGQSERLEGAVTIVVYALAYGVTIQLVRRISDARMLLSALAGAAVLLSVYGLAQYAGMDPADYRLESYGFDLRRAFATFGNPNFFGGLLVLALPVTTGLALSAKRATARTAWALGALAVTAALFATFTRSAWLAVVVQVIVGAWVWRWAGGVMSGGRPGALPHGRPHATGTRVRMALAAAAVLVIALASLSLAAEGETNIITRLTDGLSGTGSASERSMLVGISAGAVAERPLVGYGPDVFLPAFRAHRSDAYVGTFSAEDTVNNAHSWPLQYAVTLGIPGALLLLAAIVGGLWGGRAALGRLSSGAGERGSDPGAVLLAAAWIGCLGFAVQMLFNVGVLGSTVPFFVVLGIVNAPHARTLELPAVASLALAVVTGALLVVTAAASVSLVAADHAYLAARDRYHAAAFQESAALADRAVSGNPLSVKYARGAAQARAQVAQSAIIDGASEQEVRRLYGEASEAYERVITLAPADYPAHAWYAALQARVGSHLGDGELVRAAAERAKVAATFDRHHEAVRALADGDVSPAASGRAATVPALP